MNIALAQLNYIIADIKGNSEKIISNIRKAQAAGADLVVFSELAVSGYPPDDLLDYPHFINQCRLAIDKIASHCQGITAIVGCPMENPEETGRRLYNTACILSDGQLSGVVYKTLLPTYDVFNESRYFEVNDIFKTVEINGKRAAITICEDLWHEMDRFDYQDNPLALIAKDAPDIIINLSASPFNQGKMQERMEVLQKQSKAFQLPLVYVNQVGVNTDLIFDGSSVVLNRDGQTIVQLSSFKEDFVIYDTANIYEPFANTETNNIAQIYDALVFGIRDYFGKMGFKKAVLGSSGGIDSAVVQALLSDAIGSENVLAILMPSQYSSEGSVQDAKRLSELLGNPYEIIPIADVFKSFEQGLSSLFAGMSFGLAEENIQARSRAVYLMAISNKLGNILVNTSNKSEMSVGYSTLYGDMCGSLSVLGDVFKTEVYQLAAYINRDGERIPEAIIHKAPSAELRPDQKDSDSLPEYPVLDAILRAYVEDQVDPEHIIASGQDRAVVEKVIKLVNNSEYKRFQAPPILRVSKKAFGRGRVMPLVSKWR